VGNIDNDNMKLYRSKEIQISSSLKGLTRKVFEHHSNPWSAWTRLLSVPLVFVPFWTRSWRHAALVGAWLLLNPVAFPEPEDATRLLPRTFRVDRENSSLRRVPSRITILGGILTIGVRFA